MILIFLDFTSAYLLNKFSYIFFKKQTIDILKNVKNINIKITRKLCNEEIKILINALISAEDRRFFSHYGVDSKGIIRAIALFIIQNKIQGASTVTQQLVRVITNDYHFSIRRKFKEMCLACVIDTKLSKEKQAILYLQIAYFGWRMNGLNQVLQKINPQHPLSPSSAASVIARLRYPEPKKISEEYLKKINKRICYIEKIMNHQD